VDFNKKKQFLHFAANMVCGSNIDDGINFIIIRWFHLNE